MVGLTSTSTDVSARLLEAAAASYVRGGRFSVREIASDAGVNHGQIHHYFGGKSGLKRAMLEQLAERLLDDIESSAQAAPSSNRDFAAHSARALMSDPSFARALARHLVEDDAVAQRQFPVVKKLRASLRARDSSPTTATLAIGLATSLGWALFRPWIRRALQLSDRQTEQISRTVAAQISAPTVDQDPERQ